MSDRWESIQDIIMAALNVEPTRRHAYVREACSDDPEMLNEVIVLLEHYEKTGVLDHPVFSNASLGLSLPGTRVGHYEVLQRVEVGGMGVVYRARDTKLGRAVALKFLLPHLAADPTARARFLREARAASSLDHPNICTVYEVGETRGNDIYIAMAFYDGMTLDEIGKPLSLREALDIVARVGQGLAHAHKAGVIHRDIKPSNILLTDEGRVKILDFGIAKFADSVTTATAGTIGTLAYMSPEQLEGLPLDARTDVWSLGVLLYELLTGARPFTGRNQGELIRSVLQAEPVWSVNKAQIPEAAELIMRKSLRKDRNQRYSRVEDFVADLETVAKGVDGDRSASASKLVSQPVRRSSRVHAWLAVSLVVVAIVVGLFFIANSRAPGVVTDKKPTPGIVAVFPFADEDEEPRAGIGDVVARELSRQVFDAGIVTSVDYNTVLSRTGGRDVLDPQVAGVLTRQVGGQHFILGKVVRAGSAMRVDASLYDGDARLVTRLAAAEDESEGTPGGGDDRDVTVSSLADGLLHQLLSQWDVQMSADHVRYRRSIRTAAQTTQSGEALKEFVLAFYSGDTSSAEGRLERALDIDSTFAMASFVQVRQRMGSERARRLLLRYRHKLPPVEHGLTEIYTSDLTFEQKRRQYVDLLNAVNDDGALWEEYGTFLFVHGYKNGRRTVESLGSLTRARELNGFPWFLLADIGLLERDLSLLAGQVEHDLAVSDSVGRNAYWFDAKLRYAAISDDSAMFDQVLADYKQVHPIRLVAAATRIAQYGKETSYPRRVARLLVTAPELTEDWIDSGRYMDAQMDIADGRLRRGTQKLLALADDNPAFVMDVVVARIANQLPQDPKVWSELDDRLQRWDTLAADWPFMAPNPHAGSQEELKFFLQALVAFRQSDEAAFHTWRARLAKAAHRRGPSSTAAAMRNSLDAWMLWHEGDRKAAWQLLDRAQSDYTPPEFVYHSWVTDQMLDRYLRAEILYASRRYEEALTWYLSLNDRGRGGLYGIWAIGPVFFLAGDIYERLGDNHQAIENYQRLIEFWANADPELQNYVDEARRRLSQLTEEG